MWSNNKDNISTHLLFIEIMWKFLIFTQLHIVAIIHQVFIVVYSYIYSYLFLLLLFTCRIIPIMRKKMLCEHKELSHNLCEDSKLLSLNCMATNWIHTISSICMRSENHTCQYLLSLVFSIDLYFFFGTIQAKELLIIQDKVWFSQVHKIMWEFSE